MANCQVEGNRPRVRSFTEIRESHGSTRYQDASQADDDRPDEHDKQNRQNDRRNPVNPPGALVHRPFPYGPRDHSKYTEDRLQVPRLRHPGTRVRSGRLSPMQGGVSHSIQLQDKILPELSCKEDHPLERSAGRGTSRARSPPDVHTRLWRLPRGYRPVRRTRAHLTLQAPL